LREVTAAERAAAPYSQVGLLVASFADGTYEVGTCALIGRNDVLTATHMVYSATAGRATSLAFYFGVDYNSALNKFDSNDASFVLTDGFSWTAQGYASQVFSDGDNTTLTEKEMAYDVAMIGLSVPVGDSIGWLGVDPGWNFNSQGTQIGYPQNSFGMQTGEIGYEVAKPYANANVYESFTFGNMGPGSSGGPLLQDGYVIGVKVAGSNLAGFWADIGNVYADLTAFVTADDYLLAKPGETRMVSGTSGRDVFPSSPANDQIDGGAGTDTVIFSGNKADYTIALANGVISVTDSVTTGGDGHDTLVNVERIQFADYGVAFDIDGTAGQAYRLYKAAFDRVPDLPGLGYQMNALDQGFTLSQVATAFIASPEFQARYGNVTDTQFITLLYQNVLDRAPDPGGLQFHLDELAHGETRGDVLVHFSDSPENKANVIGLIQGGMTYVF